MFAINTLVWPWYIYPTVQVKSCQICILLTTTSKLARVFFWDETKHICKVESWTSTLQAWFRLLTRTLLLLTDICWFNLWLSEFGWLLEKYMGIETVYNCGQKFLNKMEGVEKGLDRWELLAQQWSICLPGNEVGGWKYWDGVRARVGSLDTGMGS